ncbi:MAG: hypothetical protein A3F78_12895 [Burkholderiales bacterium RIFCSPLOWO2_12_FULL_61_40]|nr:MAG: hypothetical protein A3F78_12895 [Burkholderiales bacterium RIFCSPLOWO2_12_FULL_61_40]
MFGRHSRLITAFLMLVSLLFTQLAVAGYVCPSGFETAAQITAMAQADMPCAQSMAASMDDTQPNLCHAYCQAGRQTADKYELPTPLDISMLSTGIFLPVRTPVFWGAPLQLPHLKRATAPPLSIRHCCFRI